MNIFQRITDRHQQIVISLVGILLICMVPLLQSILWIIWDDVVFCLFVLVVGAPFLL